MLPGEGASDYERYLSTDELLALQKTAGRVGAPRRAALPDRPPVVGALAQARVERGRGGDGHLGAARSHAALRLLRRARSACSTRRRSSTCSSRCRRGSTRRSARCSATAAASTRPGWREIRRVTPALGQAFHALREQAGLSLVDVYVRGREHEELYQLAEALIEWDERDQRLAHPPLQGRRARDRRLGRRHAGDAGGGARPADPPHVLPRALAGAERADGAVAGGDAELSGNAERLAVAAALRTRATRLLAPSHSGSRSRARAAARRALARRRRPADRRPSRSMAARPGADVTGARHRASGLVEAARRQRRRRGCRVRFDVGRRRRRSPTRTAPSTSSPRPSASSSRPTTRAAARGARARLPRPAAGSG